MKLLSNKKLTQEQYRIVSVAETILNSPDFRAWFYKARFTELEKFENSTNEQLYQKFFMNNEHRFSWSVVVRPWYKRFSSAIGMTDMNTQAITTYKQVYDTMSFEDKVGHFSHEMMHVIGFTHSFKSSPTRDKSLPYQVGEYIRVAAELIVL